MHITPLLPLLDDLCPAEKAFESAEAVSHWMQMVSLLHLAKITEEGVQFASPVDGSLMMLTPEHSMAIQNKLGAPASMWCTLSKVGPLPDQQ